MPWFQKAPIRPRAWALAVGIALVICLFTPAGRFFVGIPFDVLKSKREWRYANESADHEAILLQCRDLMAKYPEEAIYAGDARLAPIFQTIGTSAVYVGRDVVTVELHGGFAHYGFYAFAEGVPGDGDEKIIDGLWSYRD